MRRPWWVYPVTVALLVAAALLVLWQVRDQRACRARGGDPLTDRWGNTACFNAAGPGVANSVAK